MIRRRPAGRPWLQRRQHWLRSKLYRLNILSRLELLCKDVGQPLLMTDAFAVEVAAPVFEIGHFELRGFRQHQFVYGLCQGGEVPSTPKRPISVFN